MKIFGTHDQNTLDQLSAVAQNAVATALMADGHLGYIMPVGGVAAYDNKASVNGVGYDIACGNCAIKTNVTLEQLTGITVEEAKANPVRLASNHVLNTLADEIADKISFGVGRKNAANDAPTDHPLFDDPTWDVVPAHYKNTLRAKARQQIGTVGSGNHYVDVFYDETGAIWIGVHFGSRGLGHTIATAFLAIGQGGKWGDRSGETEVLLDLSTPVGQDYWAAMNLAGRYAYAGREWVTRKVMSFFGGQELDLVHNHHNFAWKEQHLVDESMAELVVVRKGATPAFPGQRGFVGGSMGDDSVILKGSDAFEPLTILEQARALWSTVHGAGRVMSRTEAAGKRNRRTGALKLDKVTGLPINEGKVSQKMMDNWINKRGLVLRGAGRDESPQAYRRLTDVLAAQENTIEVLHTLSPVIVVMAGANEFDPYKD